MVTLVTTSVVRGSEQGESHGGVFLVDMEQQTVAQKIDWNTAAIDWEGRGGDRGLRGIAFDGDTVYIAASNELFAWTPDFELLGSWRNPYLKHCHEIDVIGRDLYLTSTGYDSILVFDLDRQQFHRGIHVEIESFDFNAAMFDPNSNDGPTLLNKLHINSVRCQKDAIYFSGLRTGSLLRLGGDGIESFAKLPPGTHNGQPFRDGVLFIDSRADQLRYSNTADNDGDRNLRVPRYDPGNLLHKFSDTSRIARPGFARGLCATSDSVVAGGSSPSTVTLYDLVENKILSSVNLTMDVRNAIHGLEVWPFD